MDENSDLQDSKFSYSSFAGKRRVVLSGASNVGKTSSLNELARLLQQKTDRPVLSYSRTLHQIFSPNSKGTYE